ncbi:hypothetical protein F5148DRAFT_872478 [Russula earlei]|uniref:Uncharacterized protein n=1 Tax=Russula earlei TaxID=71964 RepID=A0ACC0UC68_9AGAM|nr:hypothetical protein F5148DRAFT_872478 [Russula earlei]
MFFVVLFKLTLFFHLGSIYGITTPQCQNHDDQTTTAATVTTQAPRTAASNCLQGGNGYNYKTATERQRAPDETERQRNHGTTR